MPCPAWQCRGGGDGEGATRRTDSKYSFGMRGLTVPQWRGAWKETVRASNKMKHESNCAAVLGQPRPFFHRQPNFPCVPSKLTNHAHQHASMVGRRKCPPSQGMAHQSGAPFLRHSSCWPKTNLRDSLPRRSRVPPHGRLLAVTGEVAPFFNNLEASCKASKGLLDEHYHFLEN